MRDAGLMRKAPWFYYAVLAGLGLALGGIITGFVLLGDSWFQLLMAAALGIVLTQFAFIAHEAAHRQVLHTGPDNDRLGRFLAHAIVGISYQWWMVKHSRHHANPNKVGKDPDIDNDTIVFTSENAREVKGVHRWIVTRQGWLFFPLLTLEGLNLHYLSYKTLARRGKVEGRWTAISVIAVRMAVYLGAVFWVLPLGMAFAFVGVQLAVFGVYMGASFAPNHKGMRLVAADQKLDFFSKQVLTSRNITGGWWSTAIFGGLNHQVEHHLYPSMARPYLGRARDIVREYCVTHDIPYTESTIRGSYAAVVRYLNDVGLSARDPFHCPMHEQWGRA